jgi:hypothetical protein
MRELQSRDYPIQEHMRFQRWTWIVERAGWLLLAVVIGAALAGLFGYGPVSQGRLQSGDLRASYERFQRVTKLAKYTFHLGGAEAERQLTLGPAFQAGYEVSDIQPRPVHSSGGRDGLTLRFGASSGGDLAVVIWAHPRQAGSITIPISYGNERQAMWSFVYP